MIIGFTGTQLGMSRQQKLSVMRVMIDLDITELHHGDCLGADSEAHDIALLLGLSSDEIHLHPPINKTRRAFRVGFIAMPPKHFLVRNKDIVNCCEALIAAPKEYAEVMRSGTWATIRAARKQKKRIFIFSKEKRNETDN